MDEDKSDELSEKIIFAMSKGYDDLIKYKKSKDSPLVVLRDGKIVRIKLWEEDSESSS
ncbi:MAG: hypothetical protein HYZ54_08215 [Ignavibacteriae bacterium]|nr:hypothetical protein [Ignavibacteriota bacterium]